MKMFLLRSFLLIPFAAGLFGTFAFNTSAFGADASNADLYKAIHAPETDARPKSKAGQPELGVGMNKKSVGGLTCLMRIAIYPGAIAAYTCTLSTEDLNAELIYNSLELEEKNARPLNDDGMPAPGPTVSAKIVGPFKCEKVQVVSPRSHPKYNCKLDF